MAQQDIRWHQRLQNFTHALSQLEGGVGLAKQRPLTDLERQGLIQAFEFTHELAWNLMKDYFDFQGASELITGSRDATREAFQKGLVTSGDDWMDMIRSRNLTSHTYNLKTATDIVAKIISVYSPLLREFHGKMSALQRK